MISNKKIGSKFEKDFANFLASKKYWVHFIEGAAHITEAKVSKITDDVFSITPKSVKLTSEIPKELESPEIRNYNPMRNDYKYNEEEEIIIKK